MLESDRALAAAIQALGGTYRRYSDDILVIVPAGLAPSAEKIVRDELAKVRLLVNAAKTERCRFRDINGTVTSIALDDSGNEISNRPSSYLGLSFDGDEVRIRDATLSRFLAKARRAIARGKIAAKVRGEKHLKRRQLYARLTGLGYGSVYGACSSVTGGPRRAPQLGFFKYLKLAERATGSAAIAKQIRQLESRVFRWLHQADIELQSA